MQIKRHTKKHTVSLTNIKPRNSLPMYMIDNKINEPMTRSYVIIINLAIKKYIFDLSAHNTFF